MVITARIGFPACLESASPRNRSLCGAPSPDTLSVRVGGFVWTAVCDLGSGTTAAVAHKMGRNYIDIERGDHAATHCVDGMQVIAGEQGGIAPTLGWILNSTEGKTVV